MRDAPTNMIMIVSFISVKNLNVNPKDSKVQLTVVSFDKGMFFDKYVTKSGTGVITIVIFLTT